MGSTSLYRIVERQLERLAADEPTVRRRGGLSGSAQSDPAPQRMYMIALPLPIDSCLPASRIRNWVTGASWTAAAAEHTGELLSVIRLVAVADEARDLPDAQGFRVGGGLKNDHAVAVSPLSSGMPLQATANPISSAPKNSTMAGSRS